MEEILYIDEHQIVYKWRCLSILICWIEHDNDFFCNCLFVSASLRAKLIFFVGSNTRMYHAILKSKISCGISETWQFGQMSQREWDWGADKDPSVYKYKAKTWALDLMLRCIPYPLISPLFANTKEVLLGQDNFKCNMVSKTVTRTTDTYFTQILSEVCDKYFPVEN